MTDQPETPRVFNVFVYGSLRPGMHNHRMAANALRADPRPTVVHGYTLYSNYGDSYPYLAAKGEGDVKGETLLIEWGRELRGIIAMEEGAGYETRIIDADVTQEDGTVLTEQVIAFIHREDRAQVRGNVVASGDWVEYYTRLEARYVHRKAQHEHLPTRRRGGTHRTTDRVASTPRPAPAD